MPWVNHLHFQLLESNIMSIMSWCCFLHFLKLQYLLSIPFLSVYIQHIHQSVSIACLCAFLGKIQEFITVFPMQNKMMPLSFSLKWSYVLVNPLFHIFFNLFLLLFFLHPFFIALIFIILYLFFFLSIFFLLQIPTMSTFYNFIFISTSYCVLLCPIHNFFYPF